MFKIGLLYQTARCIASLDLGLNKLIVFKYPYCTKNIVVLVSIIVLNIFIWLFSRI
jgi:hypothetical protein